MLWTIFLTNIEPDAQCPVLSTIACLLHQLRTLLENMNKVPGLHGSPTSPESMPWRAQRAMSSNTKLTMTLLPYCGSDSSSAGTWTWFCSQLSCSYKSPLFSRTYNRLPVHSPNSLLHIPFAYTSSGGRGCVVCICWGTGFAEAEMEVHRLRAVVLGRNI